MNKAKLLYFTVFIIAVAAFIFHVTAMGHHHWKYIKGKNITETGFNRTTVGLFMRCLPTDNSYVETCFRNTFPRHNTTCRWFHCQNRNLTDACGCDFLPSTKGIAACAIIASVFLGISIILLFVHSVKASETRAAGILLGFLPLILLLLAFIFILITLILVGSYLSRDIIAVFETLNCKSPDRKPEGKYAHCSVSFADNQALATLRQKTSDAYDIRIGWASGLEIVALVLTFLSLILYSLFVFVMGRKA